MKDYKIEDIVYKVVDYAMGLGADHAVAVLNYEKEGSLRFASSNPTQHCIFEDMTLNLGVAKGNKEAIVETNKLDDEDLKALANNALDSALLAPENPEFFEPVSSQDYIKTKTWFESTAGLSVEKCGEAVDAICQLAKKNEIDAYGSIMVTDGRVFVKNSKGLSAEQSYTNALLNITGRTCSGNGSSQILIEEADWNKLNYLQYAKKVMETAKNTMNPRHMGPGHYKVILSPRAVAEYLVFLLWALDARDADNGTSFFGRKNNNSRLLDKCFGDNITIRSLVDHPELPSLPFGQAFGSGGSYAGSMFSMGLPVKNISWIEEGIIKNMNYSPYYALIKNRQPVAVPGNIIMDGGNASLKELILNIDKGLLIESLHYVNATNWSRLDLTGLTRDGTFLIEKGEIVCPVNSFRFNDSPVKSLNRVTGMTAPFKVNQEFISGLLPYISIDDFHLSSISSAV